jgi:hypothetical protein
MPSTKTFLETFIGKVVALLSTLSIGAAIFFGGFALGDKWGYYQNNNLRENIKSIDNENKRLSETIALYEKGKSDLTTLVAKISEEKLFYVSSAQGSVSGESVLIKNLAYGEALSFRGIIYISFSDFQSEKIFKNDNSEAIRFAEGKIDFSVGTYRTESKHFLLQIGDSVRFVLDGSTYVVLLKQISISHNAFSYFPESLSLRIEIVKIS